MPNDLNRRGQPRVVLVSNGVVHASNARLVCSTLDVSCSGMGIITPERRGLGEFVRIVWALPDQRWVDADAVVVRAGLRRTGDWITGVRFLRLTGEAEAAIMALVGRENPGFRAAGRPSVAPTPLRRVPGPRTDGFDPAILRILPRNNEELQELYQQALAGVAGSR